MPDVLLVGTDGSPVGTRAIEAAGRLAQRLEMSVVVAHVQQVTFSTTSIGETLQHLIEDLELEVMVQAAAALDPLGVHWRLHLATGDPAHVLQALADDCDAAVIVVGTRGCGTRPALHRLVNGSVSSHLVHHAERPVLVVPCAQAAEAQTKKDQLRTQDDIEE
jgi:nucleotide-binding universal stress UspA family protein